jgi:hypothetical protein
MRVAEALEMRNLLDHFLAFHSPVAPDFLTRKHDSLAANFLDNGGVRVTKYPLWNEHAFDDCALFRPKLNMLTAA